MITNNFTFGSQNFRLLKWLLNSPVNTYQLLHAPGLAFGSHVRRIKDVKDYLRQYGYTIAKKRISKDCWEYRIEMLPEKLSWWQHIRGLFQQKARQEV
jgi:hypothetical protein